MRKLLTNFQGKAFKWNGNAIVLPDGERQWISPNTPSVLSVPYIYGRKQGACTDGTNIYIFDYDHQKGITYNIAAKTATSTFLDTSIPWEHGNDMAYNPNNGHLYMAAMSADGAVMEVDTSWNYVATHYLVNKEGNPYPVYRLCFNRFTNQFLSQSRNTEMSIYDQSLNFVRSFGLPTPLSATAQSCETDGLFLYRVWSSPATLEVLTVDGLAVTNISLSMTGEPEELMYDWNGNYYLSKNSNSDYIFKVILNG